VLDADLVIEKDNVLVIPLQKPQAPIPVSIPVDQFNLWKWLLEERARPAPSAQPASARAAPSAPPREAAVSEEVNEIPLPTAQPVEPEPADVLEAGSETASEPPEPRARGSADVVVEFLRSRNGAVAPRFIADSLGWTYKSVDGHLRRLKNEGIAVSPTTGYWTLAEKVVARRPAAPPPQPPPHAAAPPPPPKPAPASAAGGEATARSRAGVSPQVGRILAAMVYAGKTTGRANLASRHVSQFLAERDLRQYGARMPDMIKRGLVKKGPGVGEYQLQEKGITAIKTAQTWAWEHDGESVPDWAVHVWE
jgi:hypothetical protein